MEYHFRLLVLEGGHYFYCTFFVRSTFKNETLKTSVSNQEDGSGLQLHWENHPKKHNTALPAPVTIHYALSQTSIVGPPKDDPVATSVLMSGKI